MTGRLTALLSVSDKSGLAELGTQLAERGYELVASGGTAAALEAAGCAVTRVSEKTGFPEILGGRVKTLHPAIHGPILARDTDEHRAELAKHGLAPITLVVCNLYPFEQTLASGETDEAALVETIDIGGVTLLRAAAKNFASGVTVLCEPSDYAGFLEAQDAGALDLAARRRFAAKAFAHTARYDAVIAGWIGEAATEDAEALPRALHVASRSAESLRYGENPHQQASFFTADGAMPFEQIQGKALSYNNLLDLDGAWAACDDFRDSPTAVVVKHSNPCGLATAESLPEAMCLAIASDPISAFGSIIAVSRPVDVDTLETIGKLFLEVLLAPSYTEDALAWLARRKKNCRVLRVGAYPSPRLQLRSACGGLLGQTPDTAPITAEAEGWRVVTKRQPTDTERAAMAFAQRVVKHVKSNAIVMTQGTATVGVGAGQMNRLEAVKLAAAQAGERASGTALASDAFFPFPDGVEAAAAAGATAVIQPGGSIRDELVIEAADRLGLAMIMTGHRHFRH